MDVAAVTVTYGNRIHFLIEVIQATLLQGIDKIIIVSNGSSLETKNKLIELENTDKRIQVIDLKENTGSANGFHQGIKQAYDSGFNYIWLLDDDNKPGKEALKILKSEYKRIVDDNKKNLIALLSYREDREIYLKAINSGNPRLMLGTNNSFLGFNLFDRLRVNHKNSEKETLDNKEIGEVAVAPYGGLFFNRLMVDYIGLPDIKYFLYGDDYDYTYRLTKKGGKILLVKNSILYDLEKSFHLKKSNSLVNNRYLNTNSKLRIFYSVRNGIIFESNFVNSRAVYFFNAIIYLILLLILMLFKPNHLWKYPLILKGAIGGIKRLND